jgi:hypothetical protein
LKRLKINWAIPGLLAMIVVIVGVAWAQTQASLSPDPARLATQCSSCHTMDTHVASWKDSAHKDVACTECHADPGVAGWARMQVGRLQMRSRDKEADLSQIATAVPNERCLNCHARQMPWVMQDLKPAKLDEKGEPIRPAKSELQFLGAEAGHDVHLTMDKPLQCTDCHGGVSHGPAPSQEPDHAAAMHKLCLDCHAEQKVALDVRSTVACSACHLNLQQVEPADHQATAFRQGHGEVAKQDPKSCQQCHLNAGLMKTADAPHTLQTIAYSSSASSATIVPIIPAGTLKVPAGMKDECSECHGLTMPHPTDWLSSHAQGFQAKPELCASCHGNRSTGLTMTATGDPKALPTTDPTCTGCHQQSMPHPQGYAGDAHAQAAQLAPSSCAQCHSSANKANPDSPHAQAQFCLDCHLSKFQHAAGYAATHQFDLSRYGNDATAAGCTQCHTVSSNSCTTCHTSGAGSKQQWHPADFTATHPATLAAVGNNQAAAGCTQCHTETVNSCTACHTSGVGNQQQWHPTDWVATHKGTLAKAGNDQASAGCTKCHTQTVNACTACHKSGVTGPQQWHPANWWISHAQTTKPSDRDSCNKCHSAVEPACSKCHSSY